jgi:hypothetical protein
MNIKPCANNEIEMIEIKDSAFIADNTTSIASCPTSNKFLDNPSWFI